MTASGLASLPQLLERVAKHEGIGVMHHHVRPLLASFGAREVNDEQQGFGCSASISAMLCAPGDNAPERISSRTMRAIC
ncbi:hypothetical protein [Novosphingobium sp. 11B]